MNIKERKNRTHYFLPMTIFAYVVRCALSVCAPAAAQIDTVTESEWQSVLGGDAVSSPKRTSYGFVSISEGRILSACTGSGTVIWRRSLSDMPSQWYCVTDKDFIYLVSSSGKKLALYSPDGIMLWQTELEEKASGEPLAGRDGRVFIAGKNSVSCYGTKGTRKWSVPLPESSDFPLIEMNDGSLLYIPAATKNGASMGIRLSPYGEKLEDIVFTAKISSIFPHSAGPVIGFTTGTVGCAAVVPAGPVSQAGTVPASKTAAGGALADAEAGATTQTLWSIPPPKSGSAPELIVPGSEGFCVLYSDSTLCEYDFKTRKVLWSVKNNKLKAGKNFFSFFDGTAYLFASTAPSQSYAVSYAAAGGQIEAGKIVREKIIRTERGSRFPIITPSLHLIVCNKKWVVTAYSLLNKDETLPAERYEFRPQTAQTYGAFTNSIKSRAQENGRTVATARYASVADIAENLRSGDFGIKEYGYKRRIENALSDYSEEYLSSTGRAANVTEKNNTLFLIEHFETTDFNYAVPLFLQREEEPALIAATLRAAGGIGYDPDGKMLAAIEHLYLSKKIKLGDAVLIESAEAVYEICRYMGRPAFIKRGKAVLSDMLSGTKGALQTKVRAIMLRFIDLENPGKTK